MSRRVIVIDWGTTNFRAWLIDRESGAVIDSIDQGQGMASLERDAFATYCGARIAPWREQGHAPVYMAGMVGADQGWHKAPQLPVPLGAANIAAAVVAAPGLADAWIIPGARVPGASPDVMRGEEVQIFGALALAGVENGVCCLPGTHSKWARVREGQLLGFETVMTGEIYNLLVTRSILARSLPDTGAPEGFIESAFVRGLEKASSTGGVLNQVFSARSLFLQGSLAPQDAADYISGILIGQEVASMAPAYPAAGEPLMLIGSDELRLRYRLALSNAGFKVQELTARDASLAGMRALIQLHERDADQE